MTTFIKQLYDQYQEDVKYADPRTKDWLLVNDNPIYVWVLTAVYLAFIWLGPKYMRSRQAYSLSTFLVVYNLFLVVLSIYMCVEILLSTSAAGYPWLCAPLNEHTKDNPREMRVAKVMWWYFFSKAIELLDTVLMVLRKKNNQISFLHVFHHVSMLNIWWWVMMFIPGGLAYFGSCINCFVHVVMYAYYGLSAIPSLRGKLWFKNYITRIQLIQFVITMWHTCNSIYMQCEYPRWGQFLLGGYMVLMLILFSNFYIRAYIIRKQQRKNNAAATNGSQKKMANGSQHSNGTASNGLPHDTNNHITNGSTTSHRTTKKSV